MCSKTLTEKQLKAIRMLACGYTKVAIAKDIGVERKTIYNWLTVSVFYSEYKNLLKEIKDGLKHKATLLVNNSLDTLLEDSEPSSIHYLDNRKEKRKEALQIVTNSGILRTEIQNK